MTNELESNSSSLWFAMQVEKDLQKSAAKFATTKSNAMSSLLQWSKGEQNQVFGQIFGKIAELNWMWEKTIEKFVEQYSSYQHYLKMLFKTETEIDEHNKELTTCYSKVTTAKNQFDAAKKKGDAACITTQKEELKTMISQYTSMQEKVADIINKLEHTKITFVKAALKEQANAYVNMAGKCQAIFTAQRTVAAIIPVQNYKSTLLSNQHVFLENISKLVDSLSKKLGLVPPHKERSDTAKPVPARSRGATISHARTGKIELPVPPRSSHSLNISESFCEPIYITPNRKRSATMKPTINTATTQTIERKAAEPYESVEDWFPSQKDIPDSEGQENSYASIGSYKRKGPNHYEKIDFERQLSIAKTQSLQTQTSNPQSEYITILADTERADYTSRMTRSHSDSHLRYTSENDYAYAQASEVSIECNSLQLPVNRYSHHASLPHLPEHKVYSLPPVDTSSPQEPSSPNTLTPAYEELHSEEPQTNTTSEDRVNDNYNYQFVKIKRQVDSSPAVSLCATDNTSFQHKPQLSHLCEDLPDSVSNRLKQVQSLSLDVPSSNNDSQLTMKSHSVSQVNMLTALNKEVYSFIVNSLYPERKKKNQPSLSEIFKRYCQNEHTMPAGVPLKGDKKRQLSLVKAASLDSKMSSECSSLCSSVEFLSDSSGTTSPIQPGMSEH